jgi:hypothetical protein
MIIFWPIVTLIFILALPGVFLAIPRLINLLLPANSSQIRKRINRLAVGQTLLMVFIMSLAGTVLSRVTGLGDPLLAMLFKGQSALPLILDMLLPVFLYAVGGTLVFFFLYYSVAARLLDKAVLQVMKNVRAALKLDGCALYGGIAEEVIARWGLTNVLMFFAVMLSGQRSPYIFWTCLLLSSIFFTLSQIPAYLAAGIKGTRRFVLSLIGLNIWVAIVFGYIFWVYGILATFVAHVLFHIIWWVYDKP